MDTLLTKPVEINSKSKKLKGCLYFQKKVEVLEYAQDSSFVFNTENRAGKTIDNTPKTKSIYGY